MSVLVSYVRHFLSIYYINDIVDRCSYPVCDSLESLVWLDRAAQRAAAPHYCALPLPGVGCRDNPPRLKSQNERADLVY